MFNVRFYLTESAKARPSATLNNGNACAYFDGLKPRVKMLNIKWFVRLVRSDGKKRARSWSGGVEWCRRKIIEN